MNFKIGVRSPFGAKGVIPLEGLHFQIMGMDMFAGFYIAGGKPDDLIVFSDRFAGLQEHGGHFVAAGNRINTGDFFFRYPGSSQKIHLSNNDIIGSINKSQVQENIIPNDDFLFESKADSFGELESNSEADIFDLIDDVEQKEDVFDDIFDTVEVSVDEELLNNVVPKAVVGDDFNEVIEIDYEIDERIVPLDEHFDIPSFQEKVIRSEEPEQTIKPRKQAHQVATDGSAESALKILEEKLGIQLLNISSDERDQVMVEISNILINTLEHLGRSVLIKEKTKQDLHLSSSNLDHQTNNPVMLGRAATKLLQPNSSDLGMMKLSDAVTKSLSEINQHSVALHGATKNIMKITARKFAPKYLEYRFESTGALRGMMPKPAMMWKAYSEMFDSLHDHPEMGVEMIARDFSEEYQNMVYSLQLSQSSQR